MHRNLRFLLLLALAAPAYADRVLTEEGKVLTPRKAREEGAGYRFHFENGEVIVPDRKGILSVEIEGDMSDYVPKNDDEKKKLAEGYVRYRGKWLSKAAFEAELKREHDKSRERTEELAKHSEWRNAWTRETPHFIFKSNTSPEVLDYYCELLETYYNLMDNRIGISPSPALRRTKMTVNIYKSYEEFQELSDPRTGIGPSTLGYFWSFDKTLNFFHEYSDPAQSTWVALHECTHLLTYLIEQQYEPQIWLNEAIADYFGSSKVERDAKGKLVIKPGELQTDRVLTVQQAIKVGKQGGAQTGGGGGQRKSSGGLSDRPDTKLSELFFLSRDAFDGFQYAHAWSFVYFLNNFENGKYQKGFNRFFKGLYTLEKGIDVEPAPGGDKMVSPENIRKYLFARIGLKDKDQEQLEKDWKTYIENIPIMGPEARLKRGLYHMRMLEFEEALPDLDAAIAEGSQDPRAWWARGRCKTLSGDAKTAVEDLHKAVSMAPLNAQFRFDLSSAMLGRPSFSGRRGGARLQSDGEQVKFSNPEAKREAGLASELDPENEFDRQWFERFE
jgi:tetratricopeptide (TPR) repeat protein